MRAEATAHCAAPADAVWTALSDVESWPSWTSAMVRVELEERFEVGGRVLVVQPATRPVVWTVDEIVPGVSFRWHSRGPGFRMTAEYALAPAAAGTDVSLAGRSTAPAGSGTDVSMSGRSTAPARSGTTVSMSVRVAGPMAWAVGLIAGRGMRRHLAEQADALAARCAAPA
jgi:uncharacterized protein YndB with AHSA1/START domain